MKQLSPEELKQWMDSGKEFQLLDVREQWEYDLCKIGNATLSPLGTLQVKPPELDKEKPVIVYCHHGRRSAMGCTILSTLGFKNLYNLTGGIDAYSDQIDSTIEKY
ncbi:hypothetical protein HUU42_12860 [bacterium]|nr:hypothetical protein [bacterium]